MRKDKRVQCVGGTLSGKKKQHELKPFGPDIFWWGGGLPREGGQQAW